MVAIFTDRHAHVSDDGTLADFYREVSAHRPKRGMAWVELYCHTLSPSAARVIAHELLCAAQWADDAKGAENAQG